MYIPLLNGEDKKTKKTKETKNTSYELMCTFHLYFIIIH